MTHSSLAAMTRPRRGVAIRVTRIMPVVYSDVAAPTPMTVKKIDVTSVPTIEKLIGSRSSGRPCAVRRVPDGKGKQAGQGDGEQHREHGHDADRSQRRELGPLGAKRCGEGDHRVACR